MYKHLFVLYVLLGHTNMLQAGSEKEEIDNYLNSLGQWEEEKLGPSKAITKYLDTWH